MISSGVASPDDSLPYFISQSGPVLEARFPEVLQANGQPDTGVQGGGVEDIFTVNSSTCSLSQPNFAAAQSANDIVFRIPTPIMGDGLIENIDDGTLLRNLIANLSAAGNSGVSGSFNHDPGDGSITRFGWKAQIKSLHQFAGLAFNNEMGVTNLLFPNERPNPEEDLLPGATGLPSSCIGLAGSLPNGMGYPEDSATFASPPPNGSAPPAVLLDNVAASANWMRFLAPPPIGNVVLDGNQVAASSITTGQSEFNAIGCGTCHNQSPGRTQSSTFSTGSTISNATPDPYSDFEIHHMGSGLADNIVQGMAGGDEFRTAPLWGLGQRYYLLHDGRATDLITAINAHSGSGSEASTSVTNFNNLSATEQQEVLDFLRSL